MKLLLTGTRAPVTVDLTRAFAACGHTVYGMDSRRTPLTQSVLSGFSLCASPRQNSEAFARDAAQCVERLRPDLIIPLCEDIFYWAQIAEGRGWPLFAPDLKTLMRLHSKFTFAQMASELGLNVPPTRRLSPSDSIDRPQTSVFKPEFSRFGARLHIRPQRPPALLHDPLNPWLEQTWIDGEDICFHAIAREGRMQAFAAYRSGWRASGGASYYFEPLDATLTQALYDIAVRLSTHLKLTGQLACDLRRDPEGRLWLIECNPRATSGLHLLAYDQKGLCDAFLTSGQTCLFMSPQPCCIGPAMWLSGLPRAVSTGRLPYWRHDFKRARDVFAGQGVKAVTTGICLMAQAALNGQDLQSFLTADIECNRNLS
ncbi:MAG: ATP-dependent carboxylate-amine ligase [Asticcacaulis sp.]